LVSKTSKFWRGAQLKLAVFLLLLLCFQPAGAAHDESENGDYIKVRLRGTLWETLVENGVNPTLWRNVFDYNRRHNKAFANVRSANRIPNGITVYIPSDWQKGKSVAKRRTGPRKAVVQDTVYRLGMPVLQVRAGRNQRLGDVISQLCLPSSIRGKRNQASLVRNVGSDIRDLYRRMGRELSSYDRSFFIPLHLTGEHYNALRKRLDLVFEDHSLFVRRDSLLGVADNDIVHLALAGEDYTDLAKRYIGVTDKFPAGYPYKNSRTRHLAYMAQIIRHYNLNQPIWPGKTYFIPAYLVDGRYYRDNPEVKLVRRGKNALYYENGLKLSLEYHVTRKRMYWKRRERYLPPMERKLADGSRAYPDMILWHRTGLEPEIEEVLRSKGKEHFSLRYIYRAAVTNYYIDEKGNCFLIVDAEQNPRNHAGYPVDFRCLWNGQARVSDVSIGIEVEGGFTGNFNQAQLSTCKKLQEVLRGKFIIADHRILDHRKVACRRGPDLVLLRGRKADGLTSYERRVLDINAILDPDVLRGLVDPNLDIIQQRRLDSEDYWYNVEMDKDQQESARVVGWRYENGLWLRPGLEEQQAIPASF
jgi:N-acetyl-anhydromuramyl-L-alanine amidase AmpD